MSGMACGLTADLCLLLRELHVVEDSEDDPEEVVPPVLLKGVAVALHDLKHHRQAPEQRSRIYKLIDYVRKLHLKDKCRGRRRLLHAELSMVTWSGRPACSG